VKTEESEKCEEEDEEGREEHEAPGGV